MAAARGSTSEGSKRHHGLPTFDGRRNALQTSARRSPFDSGRPALTTHPRIRLRTVNKGVIQRTGATDMECESRQESKKKLTLAHYFMSQTVRSRRNGWHPFAAHRFICEGRFNHGSIPGCCLRPCVADASHDCCTGATDVVSSTTAREPESVDRHRDFVAGDQASMRDHAGPGMTLLFPPWNGVRRRWNQPHPFHPPAHHPTVPALDRGARAESPRHGLRESRRT